MRSKSNLRGQILHCPYAFGCEHVQIAGVVVAQSQPASARMQPSNKHAWRRRGTENIISSYTTLGRNYEIQRKSDHRKLTKTSHKFASFMGFGLSGIRDIKNMTQTLLVLVLFKSRFTIIVL